MKPMNFPGRVNCRRQNALKRLLPDHLEAKILLERIMPDAVARNIRTKKDRTARVRLRGFSQIGRAAGGNP